MTFSVQVSQDADEDIDSIAVYIAEQDGWERALHVADEIKKKIDKLDQFPERGGRPIELLRRGVTSFRETVFGPYRIIYRIDESTVYVIAVADGRRDMETFLTDRLGY